MFLSHLESYPQPGFSKASRDTSPTNPDSGGGYYSPIRVLGQSSIVRSSPAATFGKGYRTISPNSGIEVGPGSYDLSTTIGRSSYVSNIQNSPAYSLRSRHYSGVTSSDATSPGPATYTLPSIVGSPVPLSTIPTSPAYTLRMKTPNVYDKSLQSAQFPSSHDYSPNDRLTRRATTPSYSIRQRFDTTPTNQNNDIGPAAYSPNIPKMGLGMSLRPRTVDPAEIARNKNRIGIPSPLDYAIPSSVGESSYWPNLSSAYTMQGRYPERLHEQKLPGPANYSLQPSIGSGQVFSNIQNPSGVSFKGTGKGSQPLLGSSGPNIGPNSYTLPSVFSGVNDKSIFKSSGSGYTFNSRREYPTSDFSSPGPAAYHVSDNFTSEMKQQPGFSRSSRMIPSAQEKHRSTTPAPSAYGRADSAFVHRRAPAWSMRSKSERPSKSHLTPGPDSYGYASLPKTDISISMKGRWKEPPSNPSVGPGAYGVLHLPHLELLYQRTSNFKRRPNTQSGSRASSSHGQRGLQRSQSVSASGPSIFERTGLIPGRVSSHGIERKK